MKVPYQVNPSDYSASLTVSLDSILSAYRKCGYEKINIPLLYAIFQYVYKKSGCGYMPLINQDEILFTKYGYSYVEYKLVNYQRGALNHLINSTNDLANEYFNTCHKYGRNLEWILILYRCVTGDTYNHRYEFALSKFISYVNRALEKEMIIDPAIAAMFDIPLVYCLENREFDIARLSDIDYVRDSSSP